MILMQDTNFGNESEMSCQATGEKEKIAGWLAGSLDFFRTPLDGSLWFMCDNSTAKPLRNAEKFMCVCICDCHFYWKILAYFLF